MNNVFGFLKKKRPVFEETIKKPIYKNNNSSRMITIICPYCESILTEVYCMKINDVKFENCQYCGKKLDM